ncbi:6-phospho-3-hexuloisomerase [Priestia megaterium]|uniref:6-phospho-3-hexuloisomerase n=1 Tax=Priestia megaterium TaxID=1404 RepID=UPI00300BD17F
MTKTQTILDEITAVMNHIKEPQIEEVAFSLYQAKRIFVIGEGRSGLMGKSFAMRLMHLGATVYVVGETITPSIAAGDVLVAVSGSGKTQQVVSVAKKATEVGCSVIGISASTESPLTAHTDELLHIPAATKYRSENEAASIQPLGSLFDQCAHVVFDTICLEYGNLNHTDHEQAFKQHSNLE